MNHPRQTNPARRAGPTLRPLLHCRRGLPRHAGGGRVSAAGSGVALVKPATGVGHPGKAGAGDARGDGLLPQGLVERAVRGRPGRALLAETVRWARGPAHPPGDRPGGALAVRSAGPHRADRDRDGRADDTGPRDRGAEGPLPEEDPHRRGSVVPGILRAERRERPGLAPDEGRTGRRRVRGLRAEVLVELRPHRGLVHPAGPNGRLGQQARGDHVFPHGHARARGRGPATAADHRRLGVQRDLHGRRSHPRRPDPWADRAGVAGGHHHADERTGERGVRPPGPDRGELPAAGRTGQEHRPERLAGRGRPDRTRQARRPVGRRSGLPVHGLPGLLRLPQDRRARTRGVRGEALLVGDGPAADEDRSRDRGGLRHAGPGLGAGRRRRPVAEAPAPESRQHHRGGNVGDPPQHHRRACARPPEIGPMNYAFSDEQEMLRTSARELMLKRYPLERVAAIADGEGFDRSEWAAIAELGWTGISIPEEEGGAGLGFLEEMVLAEELGRALYPGPFFSSIVLALPVLAEANAWGLVNSLVGGERIATLAWAGPDGRFDVDPAPKLGWEDGGLSAEKLFVPDLGIADLLVVVGSHAGG